MAASGSGEGESCEFPYPISLAKPGDNPREFYERMVAEGKIRHDDRQLQVGNGCGLARRL